MRNFVGSVALLAALGFPAQDSKPASPKAETAAESRPAPFARLSFFDPKDWTGDTRWNAFVSEAMDLAAMEKSSPVAKVLAEVKKNFSKIEWPIHVSVTFDAHAILLSVALPASNADLLHRLIRELGYYSEKGKQSAASGAQSWMWSRRNTPDGEHDYESDFATAIRGSRLYLMVSLATGIGPEADIDELIAAASFAADSAVPKELALPSSARGIVFLMNFKSMLEMVPGAEGKVMRSVFQAIFGKSFNGAQIASTVRDGRVWQDMRVDVRPGEGVFGQIIDREAVLPNLARWIPEDSKEFVLYNLTTKNFSKIAGQLRLLGIPIDPQNWGDRFAPLADEIGNLDIAEIIQTRFSGEVLILNPPLKASDITATEGGVGPAVVLASSPAGPEMLHWLREFTQKNPELEWKLSAAGSEKSGIQQFSMQGRPIAALGTAPGIAAISTPDPASVKLLETVLATKGKGAIPEIVSKRLGKDALAKPYYVLASSRLFSDLGARFNMQMQRAMGTPIAAVPEIVTKIIDAAQRHFSGDDGLAVSRGWFDDSGITAITAW